MTCFLLACLTTTIATKRVYSYQICLAVFNLRGNCRTSGEQRRKESGNVFGEGSRTPISITILVRKPKKSSEDLATILYKDIGDYLTREDKLKTIQSFASILSNSMGLSSIAPNEVGDWINQRDGLFETFIPLGDKNAKNENAIFTPCYSCGVKTNRDSWVYNFSRKDLERNISSMIDFYNDHVSKSEQHDSAEVMFEFNAQKISWSDTLRQGVQKHMRLRYQPDCITTALYRPFCKQMFFNYKPILERTYQMPRLFPTPQSKNLVICISGVGVTKEFSCLIVDSIPDLELIGKSQCFPLYWYTENERDILSLFDKGQGDYARHSGITDFILRRAREEYGPKVTPEDVFFYVYGLLHSPDYRKRFSSDLKKTLARIPLVASPLNFKAFVKAGRQLADLHLNYETGPFCAQLIITGDNVGNLRVTKMRFSSKEDKGTILFNETIKVENIPMVAYDYVVNGKSAVEWVMERYAVTRNADSGIVNDPNAWSDNPRYILDLLNRVIQMSVETQKIVAGLPRLDFSPQRV